MIDLFRSADHVNHEDYIFVDYYVESTVSLEDAALNIAIGQSVGNPKVRSEWETDELFENHSAFITHIDDHKAKTGHITLAYPTRNTDFITDGVSHMLCQFMGGQLDIDSIVKCHLNDVVFPDSVKKQFKHNKDLQKVRSFVKAHDKPLLGGIIKPKTGLNKEILTAMVSQMIDNGVNFIKEDEIMSNLPSLPIHDRVNIVRDIIGDRPVVYCHCINSDPYKLEETVNTVVQNGGNGVHINVHSGLGSYRSIREIAPGLFIHFQKSGDKLFTNPRHDFHIKWKVICKLAILSGVDFIHVGMIGGYSNSDEREILDCCHLLSSNGVVPALSCGMHPGLVEKIRELVGNDWMANVGGALHGHPGGTSAGVRAMAQAINKDYGQEYYDAINKWGLA